MIISFLLCSPENGTVHFFPAATIAFGTYTASSLSIYLLIDILFACMSWLLSILLQCMFACLCLFYSGILTVSAHQGIGRIIWQLSFYLLNAAPFCSHDQLLPVYIQPTTQWVRHSALTRQHSMFVDVFRMTF